MHANEQKRYNMRKKINYTYSRKEYLPKIHDP